MDSSDLHIYINPQERTEEYPDSLYGNMSVFNGFRNEVQWLFYLLLKEHFKGLNLSRGYPQKGLLLIHKSNVKKFVWNPDLFVVSAQWDHPRDDRAQIHLVPNQYKTTRAALGLLDRVAGVGLQFCVPPVMHPVITPRRESRGDVFENVVFMGNPKNLDNAFLTEEFNQRVTELGMKFIIVDDPHKHADFSEVDVSLAIRKIGKVVKNKPAVKLYNAWRGQVPSMLGCEIGFREVRKSEYDYIEVDSVDEVILALTKLKHDIEFRTRMIANAKERGKDFLAEAQKQRWVEFFENTIIPAYEDWQKTSKLSRYWFLCRRWHRFLIRKNASYLMRKFGYSSANYH